MKINQAFEEIPNSDEEKEGKVSTSITAKPKFLNEEARTKISNAEKGTLMHLCVQKMDEKQEYDLQKIDEMLLALETKEIITGLEAENINKSKLLEYTKSELWQELKEAKLVLLTDYRGINVTDVTKLRKDLREADAEYKVIKNNIVRRALEANGESALDEVLEGPVALVIGKEDYLAPSKVIYNFTKDHDFYKIKGGIVEGKVMTAEEIITLAKLPSRQELLAKLAGALLGNITKLAVALDQVKSQKENA